MNAILNYAYAVLESHVRIEVISRGYDPTIGYLHAFEKYRAALVCDLMEPLRPVVDRAVLEFVQQQTVTTGQISVQFVPVVGAPGIFGIEIVAGTPTAPTVTSIAPNTGSASGGTAHAIGRLPGFSRSASGLRPLARDQ